MPLTRERAQQLAKQAESDIAELEQLLKDARQHVVELEELLKGQQDQAQRFRRMAAPRTRDTLTEPVTSVNTPGISMMEKSQRVNISRAKRRKGDKISAGINKADLSKNALAARLGVTPAALSRWISGDRRIPQSRAEEIAVATKGNVPVSAWPNLSTDDA